jgi:hypothetical protein
MQVPSTSLNAATTGRHWKMLRKVRTVPAMLTIAMVKTEAYRRNI